MKQSVLYTAFDVVPSPKGASTHITYFTRGLVKAGFDLTLITAGDPALPERDIYYGATLLRAPAGDDLNFLKRALAFGDYVLAHVAESEPYSVVHVRSIWSGLPLAEARSRYGYKLLYEVNGLPSIEMKYHYPALRSAPVLDKIREWEVATLHLADAIICPSQVTAAYIASLGISSSHITVIPNGIDPELFSTHIIIPPNLPEDHGERKIQGALAGQLDGQSPLHPADGLSSPAAPATEKEPDAPPTILYVGTLADWQGLDVLIEAMPLILAERAVRLRLVGRGRKRQRKVLQKRANKLGVADYVSIEPATSYKHVPALMAQAQVTVAPLGYNDRNVTQGCCPLKVLEYMACGRPIVASNLPVVRELVGDGTEALLFNPDDPADLAQKILMILTDPALAAQLGANAADRVRRQFTWAAAQDQLLTVYQALFTDSKAGDTVQDFSPTQSPA